MTDTPETDEFIRTQLEQVGIDQIRLASKLTLKCMGLERERNAAIAERDLWKAEAERWRQMYMEYDEMLEGQVQETVERLNQIWEDLDELKRKVENDMLDD